MGSDGGSSIYYASLSSSVHKINGTRKKARLMDDASSMAQDSMTDMVIEEEDPEEELRRKREEAKRYRNNKDENTTIIGKLKEKLAKGEIS